MQPAKRGERRRPVLQQHGFRHLELEPVDGEAAVPQRLADGLAEPRARELHGRKIDRQLDRGRPARRFAAGFAQCPRADVDDQSRVLGNGDESVRSDEAALGMPPAQQRLRAAHLHPIEIDERLVVYLQLVACQRLAQVPLQLAALVRPGVHFRLEELVGAAPCILGGVQRHLCLADQLVGRHTFAGHDDADARRHAHVMTL